MEMLSLSHHVTSFTLFLWDNKYDLSHLTKWISVVLGPNIRTFRLTYAHKGIVLPQSLLECTSLRHLELKLQCTFRVPSVVNCFPNLVKLSLHSVELFNEDFSKDTLILKFKVLETLELYICKWLNMKFVEIHAPALTTFKFNNKYEVQEDHHSIINIIGANMANFEVCHVLNFVLTGSTVACALVEVYIDLDSLPEVLEVWKLFTELSSVEYLIVKGNNIIKAIAEFDRGLSLPRFDRLERLDIGSSDELEGLLALLHATPFLKILEIDVISQTTACWRNDDFDAVNTVPSCIISSLEEVKFRRYYYLDHRFELEKFLLRNGKQLKKVTLQIKSGMPRDEFVKQLKTFPRASSTSLDIVVI